MFTTRMFGIAKCVLFIEMSCPILAQCNACELERALDLRNVRIINSCDCVILYVVPFRVYNLYNLAPMYKRLYFICHVMLPPRAHALRVNVELLIESSKVT